MARYHYERLSAESASFLMMDGASRSHHTAATLIFDAGPLATPEGGVDIDTVREARPGAIQTPQQETHVQHCKPVAAPP